MARPDRYRSLAETQLRVKGQDITVKDWDVGADRVRETLKVAENCSPECLQQVDIPSRDLKAAMRAKGLI